MMKLGFITMALLSFLHANWFSNLFDSTPTPPISLPIDLSKAGSVVESEVRLEEDGLYDFGINIPFIKGRDDIRWKTGGISDGAIVDKIIGCNKYEPRTGKIKKSCSYKLMYKDFKKDGIIIDKSYNGDGTIIPIKLTIYKILINKSKEQILNKVYETKGRGNCSMCRMIIEMRFLKGKYSIKVENIKAIEEMKVRKASIDFGRAYHGK